MGVITFEVEIIDVDTADATAKMNDIKTKVAAITDAKLMGLKYRD